MKRNESVFVKANNMWKDVPGLSLNEKDGDRDERQDEHMERVSLLSADDVVVGELVATQPLFVVLDIL